MITIVLELGIWFWGLVIIEFLLLMWFIAADMEVASIASIIIFLFLLEWLADIPIWLWIKNNPKNLIIGLIIYIVAGTLWSIIKYYFQLSKTRRFIKEQKENWIKNDKKYDGEVISLEDYVIIKAKYDSKVRQDIKFDTSLRKLVFWAMLWPPSMIWTLLDEPIRRFFTWLINDVFIDIYRSIHKKMIDDTLKNSQIK